MNTNISPFTILDFSAKYETIRFVCLLFGKNQFIYSYRLDGFSMAIYYGRNRKKITNETNERRKYMQMFNLGIYIFSPGAPRGQKN